MVGVLAERLQDVFAARQHLVVIVGGDVEREQLGLAGLVLGATHRVVDRAHRLLERREHLVALRLVVLDEVAAEPEIVAGVGEGLRPQAELRLDDGADDEAAVDHRAAQHAPQILDRGRRTVEQLQIGRRHVEVVHLGVFDVAHALVVADRQRQERGDHGAAVDHVAIEQFDRIGDLHQLLGFVDLVDERVDAAGEVVGGRHFDVGAGGGFGGEMRRGLQEVAEARPSAS